MSQVYGVKNARDFGKKQPVSLSGKALPPLKNSVALQIHKILSVD
jgi:hypothetical protein